MSEILEIPIETEEITLQQFLKWANLVSTGGNAKNIIKGGSVKVNGEIEVRRGRKLKVGDIVSIDEFDKKLKVIKK